MFGFTLTFARVLSVLKSGYPAESIGYHFHRELLILKGQVRIKSDEEILGEKGLHIVIDSIF